MPHNSTQKQGSKVMPGTWFNKDEQSPQRSSPYRVRGLNGGNTCFRYYDRTSNSWGPASQTYEGARVAYRRQRLGLTRKNPRNMRGFMWLGAVPKKDPVPLDGPSRLELLEDLALKATKLLAVLPAEGSQSYDGYFAKEEVAEMRSVLLRLESSK